MKKNSGTAIAKAKSFFPHILGLAVCVAAVVLVIGNARADFLCSWLLQCFYESPGFKIRVVDKETGKPLADVHALAEWIQYGYHGTGGPLMVQDAVSSSDGRLDFPGWGPIRGSTAGLSLNQDPVVSLFRPGYVVLIINNAPGRDERARVRGLKQDGQTFVLERFQGPVEAWINELRLAANPTQGGVPQGATREMRDAYLKRFRVLDLEARQLPSNHKEVDRFVNYLRDRINFVQGDRKP